MKKLITLSLCIATLYVNAQNIKLESGKKITTTTATTMDMDMGMMGQMKMNSTTTNLLNITTEDANGYKGTTTITKMTISQEGMGQSTNFDSEKKEDLDSEMGKALGKEINQTSEVSINKATGKAVELNKKETVEEEGNPLSDLMGANGSKVEATTTATFFIIPAGKKVGDIWTDSLNETALKGLRTLELKSITDDVATINIKSTGKTVLNKEVQGMSMDINMTTIADGTILVDTKSGLVKKNTSNADVTGTIEMAGQSMPVTMKMTTTATAQ